MRITLNNANSIFSANLGISITDIDKPIKNMCSIIDSAGQCYNDAISKNLNVCKKHHRRYIKHKTYELPAKPNKKCKYIDCNNKYFALGFCKKHHKAYRKIIGIPGAICSAEKCSRPISAKNLCARHYLKLHRNSTLCKVKKFSQKRSDNAYSMTQKNIGRRKNVKCLADGCSNSHKLSRGLCTKHYTRWYKTGQYKYTIREFRKIIESKNAK